MIQRFISNLALAVAGAIAVVATQAFSDGIIRWLLFGVSLGALALLGLVQRDLARGRVQHALDAGTGALAVWSAVASVVYSGSTLMWLSLGEAIGFVVLGLAGMLVHELQTERVVRALEAVPADASDRAEELQEAA
jgi:hypothetical protein